MYCIFVYIHIFRRWSRREMGSCRVCSNHHLMSGSRERGGEGELGKMDTEMEIEGESTPGSIHGNDNVTSLLELARQLITQGKPTLALQAVVMALRTSGGDTAVFQTLHRARELYRNRLRANAAAEELASLFAECAIAEAQPEKSETLPFDSGGPSMVSETVGSSILAQTGRKQLVLDAFADGSSFICLQCGGLVSNQRREEHLAYWCCQI